MAVQSPEAADRAQRRRQVVLISALAVLLGVLAGCVITLGVVARSALGRQQTQLTALREQERRDAEIAPLADLGTRPTMDAATLATLRAELTAVQAADAAVETEVATWLRGDSELSRVWTALGRCMAQVDAYDRAAAGFTAAELKGLPAAIDLAAEATDCGRETIERRAGAGSL